MAALCILETAQHRFLVGNPLCSVGRKDGRRTRCQCPGHDHHSEMVRSRGSLGCERSNTAHLDAKKERTDTTHLDGMILCCSRTKSHKRMGYHDIIFFFFFY